MAARSILISSSSESGPVTVVEQQESNTDTSDNCTHILPTLHSHQLNKPILTPTFPADPRASEALLGAPALVVQATNFTIKFLQTRKGRRVHRPLKGTARRNKDMRRAGYSYSQAGSLQVCHIPCHYATNSHTSPSHCKETASQDSGQV